jgi:hypothetical protein
MPCDPACQAYTVPGPFTAVDNGQGVVVGISGGYVANSTLPGTCSWNNGGATAWGASGFMAKVVDPDGVCSECSAANTALNGSVTTGQCQSACLSDQHCTGNGTDSCTSFSPGQQQGACAGVDVTVPIACQDSNGNDVISVCNRGTVAISSPIECCQFPGNSAHFADELSASATSCAGGTYLGSTSGTIAAGSCQAITTTVPGNTSSIICNPHYTQTGGAPTTTPATYASTPSGSSGGWTTVDNTFGAGDATALLGRQTVTTTFDNSYANGSPGWASFANAQSTSADGSNFMTATVSVPAGTPSGYKLPTANAAVSATGWANPANAQSDTDGNAVASGPAVTSTLWAPVETETSGAGAGAVAWWNPRNATGSGDSTFAENWPGKNATSTMTLSGYGALPVLTSLTVTATVKNQGTVDECTVTIDLVDSGGTNPLGSTHLFDGTIGSTTAVNKSYTLTAGNLTTINANAAFMADPRVRITISPPNGNPAQNKVYIDAVKFDMGYAPTHSYGNFSFGAPPGSTISQIDWSVRLRNTAPASGSSIKVQGFAGATPVGTAKTFTTSSSPALTNALAVSTWSDTGLALTDAQVANGTFTARVEAAGSGTPEIEYLKAQVTYITGSTNTIVLKNFNLNIPSGATIASVVTNTTWKTSAATGMLGIQPFANSGMGLVGLGSETTATGSTTATAATHTYAGALAPSALSNGNFEVHLRASGTTTGFTASVDYVSVTVVYNITSASVDLGNFGFNIPAGATITALNLSLREKVSNASPTSTIQAEAFHGATSFGALALNSSPGTGYSTDTASGTWLGVPSDYANGTFIVRLTATSPASTSVSFNAFADYVTSSVTYQTGTAKGIAECNDYNNWTAFKTGNTCNNMTLGATYTATTLSYDYQPTCPTGTRVQWGYLSWDGITPSAGGSVSSIKFEASTQPLTPVAGSATPFGEVASTKAPKNNPPVCPLLGVSGCPIDVYTALGSASGRDDKLTLNITLTPSCDVAASPCQGTVTPTLNNWNLTYSCIAAE